MRQPPRELTDRLLAVSDRLLAPDDGPSIDEVASLTGVPRATLYYHFAGRQALVDFLLADKVARIGDRIDEAARHAGDAFTRLDRVLTVTVETIAEHPALCTTLASRLAVLPDDHPLRVAVRRSVLRPLERLLATGAADGALDVDNAEVMASALYGAVSTAALSCYIRDGQIDARPLVDILVPRLVTSVSHKAGGAGTRHTER